MNTKTPLVILAALFLCSGPGHAEKRASSEKLVPPGLETRIKQFFTDKAAQAHVLAKLEEQPQAPEIWDFFEAGENGDWKTVASLYGKLRRGAYQYEGTKKDSRLE